MEDKMPLAMAELAVDQLLAGTDQSAFSDSDGLISFVNFESSFVQDNAELPVGRSICDKIANFYSTLRPKVFLAMQRGAINPPPGDPAPATLWDSAVTHYMQFLLQETGGLTNYSITTQSYTVSQFIQDFSTSFVKILFDAVVVPSRIIEDVTNFLQAAGDSLRVSWDDRSRSFQYSLLAQCHEAVRVAATGSRFVYFPKVKFVSIRIDSRQRVFTTPCSRTEVLEFDFEYEYYVTALSAAVLDESSSDNKRMVRFLDKAQGINYEDADNKLDAILDSTSDNGAGLAAFGGSLEVDLTNYPRAALSPPRMIQTFLNNPAALADSGFYTFDSNGAPLAATATPLRY
jgi:hypothetical protein